METVAPFSVFSLEFGGEATHFCKVFFILYDVFYSLILCWVISLFPMQPVSDVLLINQTFLGVKLYTFLISKTPDNQI